jgi:hypothetical protein
MSRENPWGARRPYPRRNRTRRPCARALMALLRASNPAWHESDGDPPRWVFRGHRDARWRLKPRAWRTATLRAVNGASRLACALCGPIYRVGALCPLPELSRNPKK